MRSGINPLSYHARAAVAWTKSLGPTGGRDYLEQQDSNTVERSSFTLPNDVRRAWRAEFARTFAQLGGRVTPTTVEATQPVHSIQILCFDEST